MRATTPLEYTVMAALIAMLLITGIVSLAPSLELPFSHVVTALHVATANGTGRSGGVIFGPHGMKEPNHFK